MPLFAAAVVAARRGRMAITVRVSTPPLWWLLIDEAVTALRAVWARVSGRRHVL